MSGADVARPEIDMLFPIRRRVILQQFNLVSGRFENGERDLGAGHTGDFAGELTRLVGLELKPADIPPKGQRTLEVRDRDSV